MQGIDATFDGVSFDQGGSGSPRLLNALILGAFALASVGCVAAYVWHVRHAAVPEPAARPAAAQRADVASSEFGAIIVEPGWISGAKRSGSTMRLDAAPSASALALPQLDAFPAPPARGADASAPPVPVADSATAAPLPADVPLPPIRDVARIEDEFPLPPPRPPEFGTTVAKLEEPRVPLSRLAEPGDRAAPAPGDNRNLFQKLFSFGRPSGATLASAPAAPPGVPVRPPAASVASTPAAPSAASAPPVAAAPSAGGQGRGGFGGLFAAFNRTPSFDRLGFDGQTAVYDISARTVYLPDGTRLEAHSGLGDRLDDPRYVSERMLGPTPPNVYELTPREALFHGVQALRLTPIGDGPLFGRAGLLAHPYMLGPNGDSNGCVSVKDYAALLRAYESGQVKKLAVVAKL